MDLGFIKAILEKADVQSSHQNSVLFYDPWSGQFFYMLTPSNERDIYNVDSVTFKSIGHGQAVRKFRTERGTFQPYMRNDGRNVYILSTCFNKQPASNGTYAPNTVIYAMDEYPCYYQIQENGS